MPITRGQFLLSLLGAPLIAKAVIAAKPDPKLLPNPKWVNAEPDMLTYGQLKQLKQLNGYMRNNVYSADSIYTSGVDVSSGNYVEGMQGFIVQPDGTAEFNEFRRIRGITYSNAPDPLRFNWE